MAEPTPPDAASLVDAARSRGEIKRLGARLDRDAGLRAAVVALARSRGRNVPDEALDWSGKRLLRFALSREEDARVRTNPIARDEGFVCLHCGLEVAPHGRTARDHCPRCLRSLHVDEVPGDRASGCGGILDPVGFDKRGKKLMITYLCRRCGALRVNRALLDGSAPDDWEQLVALSSRPPWPT